MSWKKITDPKELKAGDKVRYTTNAESVYEGKLEGSEVLKDRVNGWFIRNTMSQFAPRINKVELWVENNPKFKIGDILDDGTNNYQYKKVLDVGSKSYALSDTASMIEDLNDELYSAETFEEVERKFKLVKTPTLTEVTLEEVAKLLGKDVKDIRIKD